MSASSCFGSLSQFSKELKAYPDFILLAEYVELKEKGLRKQYYNKLGEFLGVASNFGETKRRELVQLICHKKAHTALERSLALNPTDEIVRKELIRRHLDYLNYSMYHLNDNFYIGDPSEGLKLCWTVEAYLENVQDRNTRIAFSQELKEYLNLIQDWQEYESSNIKMNFFEWGIQKKTYMINDLRQIYLKTQNT